MAEERDEEDDLTFVKASQALLAELEDGLPKLLWKPSRSGADHGEVHTKVRPRSLARIIETIDQFQEDPQLLDTRLKLFVPPIVDAYLERLSLDLDEVAGDYVDLQTAVCSLLYTLCKVRGPKVIVGFLNNEPRHLEAVLVTVEKTLALEQSSQGDWRVPYVLLLWLSHLLLAPFDLSTISNQVGATELNQSSREPGPEDLPSNVPPLVERIVYVAFEYLPSSTKAQDAAAAILVRLVTRPDMQKIDLAKPITLKALRSLLGDSSDVPSDMYGRIGPLRFLAGIATSADLRHLVPNIYRVSLELANDENGSQFTSNAVAKKLLVKVLRNTALLALRSTSAPSDLTTLLEEGGLLEEVIDYLLRSLGDRDTPVRYAAAKAVSMAVLELEPEMAHQIIQAVLDEFKADASLGLQSADALKWHGLTLAISHTLFKRSAAVEQLPDILNCLVNALNFEQRTSTGSAIGTNVRDAACFGIWSLSRRYSTNELLAVDVGGLDFLDGKAEDITVIQVLAVQLIQSACLDPAGNIRRGSSAALQELIGRHPNKVHEGIALVQIVDYQAVGLRRRAMIDVASKAANLGHIYWSSLVTELLAWRGLGSPDVPSRESAAASLGGLSAQRTHGDCLAPLLRQLSMKLASIGRNDTEILHGTLLTFANVVQQINLWQATSSRLHGEDLPLSSAERRDLWKVFDAPTVIAILHKDFNAWIIRAELPAAAGKLVAELSRLELSALGPRTRSSEEARPYQASDPNDPNIEIKVVARLLARHEPSVLAVIPSMVTFLFLLKRWHGCPLGCLAARKLTTGVAADGMKSIPLGSGRAIALGVLSAYYDLEELGEKGASGLLTICDLATAPTIDWRIIGQEALLHGINEVVFRHKEVASAVLKSVNIGLNDYTIDERGDVGSLVRIKALNTAGAILALDIPRKATEDMLWSITRLSFEKLDRVRLPAARLRMVYGGRHGVVSHLEDVASVSSFEYFAQALGPLVDGDGKNEEEAAILTGLVSCAGVSAETLLQASRAALADALEALSHDRLLSTMSTLTDLLRCQIPNAQAAHTTSTFNDVVTSGRDILQPTLALLDYLLTTNIPESMSSSEFSWRNLLSLVQKAHFKCSDIPRLLSCVAVYRSLLSITAIRQEVLKKLCSMLVANPYPKVRIAVAEVLWSVTSEAELRVKDWGLREAREDAKRVGEIIMSRSDG